MFSLLLALSLIITPNYGFEPLPVKIRFKLDQPTQRSICVWFNADGIEWRSCFDGEVDKLFYEKKYNLDAGNYQIWIESEHGRSSKVPVTVIESEKP